MALGGGDLPLLKPEQRSQGGYNREVFGLPTNECQPRGLCFFCEMTLAHFYHLLTGLFEFSDSAFCSQSLRKPFCPIQIPLNGTHSFRVSIY